MRLLLLAQAHAGQKTGQDPFAAVTKDIDGFIADLKKEEEADMAEKEMCEKERAERTNRVQIYSKQIDKSTEVIGRLTEHIAASQKQVDSINVEIKENEDAKKEATEIRNKEKVEYGESVDDDTAAGKVVENAIAVLKSFYENNELAAPGFVQVRPARPAVSLRSWRGSRRTSRRTSGPRTRRRPTPRRPTTSSAPTSTSRSPSSRAPGPTS